MTMYNSKLGNIFAWIPFGLIQLGDFSQWIADHPTFTEYAGKLFWTALCATVYHFVLKFWKKRDEKNNPKA